MTGSKGPNKTITDESKEEAVTEVIQRPKFRDPAETSSTPKDLGPEDDGDDRIYIERDGTDRLHPERRPQLDLRTRLANMMRSIADILSRKSK